MHSRSQTGPAKAGIRSMVAALLCACAVEFDGRTVSHGPIGMQVHCTPIVFRSCHFRRSGATFFFCRPHPRSLELTDRTTRQTIRTGHRRTPPNGQSTRVHTPSPDRSADAMPRRSPDRRHQPIGQPSSQAARDLASSQVNPAFRCDHGRERALSATQRSCIVAGQPTVDHSAPS